ncbi:hypothetical protein D3C87_335440 [compost metagenome]
MKKSLLFLSLISSVYFYSQDFSGINKILEKIEQKGKKMKDASNYDLKGKKFVMVEDFEDHAERHILEFNADGTLTMIELIDDKSSGESFSNIFTGDYIRKRNAISVRANFLEGKKIAMPISINLYLMNASDIWYLKDINNSKRWIENNNLVKKK